MDGPLAIHEAVVRSTGGYAGVYDPATSQIEIAYAASDGVIIHELAHAWFNGRLVADKWAAEAFASYYAALAAREIGVDPASPQPPTAPGDWAIPLNAWGPAGSVPAESDAWAYAKSLALASTIATLAGPDAMHAVWAAAAGGIGAYQPDATGTEAASGPPDWRGLLDLLEDKSGRSFSDLWLAAVARPTDVAALQDRAATRVAYQHAVVLAGDWRLPPIIRSAMRAWQFDLAREQLLGADALIARRDALEHSASAAGLHLPPTVRTDFEGDAGVAAASDEASAEQAVVDAIVAARGTAPTERGAGERLIISVGLLGTDPAGDVDRAAAALTSGDLERGYALATGATEAWRGAAALGRSRIVSAALLLLAVALLAGLIRQRRRSRGARSS
jgi:hypothetical protein